MHNNLSIQGFKCFSNNDFELNNLTVLTGNNGTGKSSVIQAILLIRLAIEKNLRETKDSDYLGGNWKGYPTPLDMGYDLSLGTISDIFYEHLSNNDIIQIKLDSDIFEIKFPSENDEESFSANIELANYLKKSDYVPFWRKKEFYYLHTERLGPRFELNSNFTDFINCGFKGEYTAQVLLNNTFLPVQSNRMIDSQKSNYLPQQVNGWLNYISPNTNVKPLSLGSFSAQLKIGNNSSSKEVLATNYGFGISYVLPIIITGLIAEKGSVFIVENPEAHLHPKGQSNIGFFLGKIAASGVKIIIETHSEHVINGIRRAVITSSSLKAEDVAIYFFNNFDKKEERIAKININPNGDLSDFPLDFFDQTRQDLLEILKYSNR